MVQKPPRRTSERILETSLRLFNRFGEPNVSTTLISAELSISPGNLYYHYPAKHLIVDSLCARHEQALIDLVHPDLAFEHMEEAWKLVHSVFARIWDYRFLYRDLHDLLSRNRRLESTFQNIWNHKQRALTQMIEGLHRSGCLLPDANPGKEMVSAMAVLLSYWLNYEYVRAPREALEPATAPVSWHRGTTQVLGLLRPHLSLAAQDALQALIDQPPQEGVQEPAPSASAAATMA